MELEKIKRFPTDEVPKVLMDFLTDNEDEIRLITIDRFGTRGMVGLFFELWRRCMFDPK